MLLRFGTPQQECPAQRTRSVASAAPIGMIAGAAYMHSVCLGMSSFACMCPERAPCWSAYNMKPIQGSNPFGSRRGSPLCAEAGPSTGSQCPLGSAASLQELLQHVDSGSEPTRPESAYAAGFSSCYKLLSRARKQRQVDWARGAWRPSRLLSPSNVRRSAAAAAADADADAASAGLNSDSDGDVNAAAAGAVAGSIAAAGFCAEDTPGAGGDMAESRRGSGGASHVVQLDAGAELSALRRLLPLLLRPAGTTPHALSSGHDIATAVAVLGLARQMGAIADGGDAAFRTLPGPSKAMVPASSDEESAGVGAADPSTSSRAARATTPAVSSMPPLNYASACDAADELCAGVAPQLLSLSAESLIRILTGLAYLDLDPGPEWRGMADAALLSRVRYMSGRQTVAAVHALSLSPGVKPHAGLLGDLLAHCQGRLQQLRPATQAQLLQALVRVGFRPRPEWLSAYAQASVSKLSGLSTSDASRVLACCWELRWTPPPWWLRTLLSSSLNVLHLSSQADAASLLYHAARLNVSLPPAWLHEVLTQARGVRAWPPPTMTQVAGARGAAAHARAAAARVAAAAVPPRSALDAPAAVRLLYVVARERDDPRVVPHVAWARKALQSLLAANAPDRQRRRRRDLAIEDVHPTEEWPSAQQRALSATGELSSRGTGLTLSGGLSSLSPQLLVDLLYVVAQLGLETRPGQGAAVRRLCSCLHHVREQLSPGNLASVLVCLAVLKRRPAPSFVHAIFTRVSSLLERFSPQELANAITASGYLGLQPGEELLRQITRRLRKYDLVQLAMFVRKLEQATPRDSAEWLLELRDTAKNLFASKA